jgi:hypothetical protein
MGPYDFVVGMGSRNFIEGRTAPSAIKTNSWKLRSSHIKLACIRQGMQRPFPLSFFTRLRNSASFDGARNREVFDGNSIAGIGLKHNNVSRFSYAGR